MAGITHVRSGAGTVIICMLANNFTLGLSFGSFGAMLLSNEQAFGVARGTISFGMSAVSTTLGVSALLMGNLVRRLTPRRAIAIGVAASTAGFAGLGLTKDFNLALVLWAMLGFGAAMAAILGPVTMAAELFPGRTGKVLGMVNLPFVLLISPWAVTTLLPALGREGAYLLMAGLLVPILVLVLNLPATATQARADTATEASGASLLTRPDFWLLALGIAIIAGSGTAFTVHAIAYAEGRGLSPSTAALIMSAYSGAGLIGVPAFGWLADWIGAPRTLALSALIQSSCWAGLAVAPPDALLPLAAMLGMATVPLTPLHGTAMAQKFGASRVGRAMGLSFAIKLPFLFGGAPALGFAYLRLGDYRPALLFAAVTLIGSMVMLLGSTMRRLEPRADPLTQPA